MRRPWWIFGIGILGACGGFWAFDNWRLQSEWDKAQRDVRSGRFVSALPRLTRLASRWPGHGEVQYDFGICESALGHLDRAEAAWARVPTHSDHAARAAMKRARQALKFHRLSVAEPLLPAALEDPCDVG